MFDPLIKAPPPLLCCRRTLGVAAMKAGKQTESELHRTYDNLTAAYSTEVSTTFFSPLPRHNPGTDN